MPQSLVKNYIHIVFSTKHRQPIIFADLAPQLHSYLAGTCKNLDCPPIKIGGYLDHVHILCQLSKKLPLIKLLEEVKSSSSKWAKTIDDRWREFYWQNGYGAFSVNPAQVDQVVDYIENQESHHKKKTFQDEYRGFLNEFRVEYDERYVWD